MGSSTKITTVTNSNPNATEMAMGMRNCAWKLLLSIRGARPATVVTVVNKMGLNRLMPASQMASCTGMPSLRLPL